LERVAPVAGALMVLVALIVTAVVLVQYRRHRRRVGALRQLLDDADRLEADLRECRSRLDRAHAVMAAVPGMPAAGETAAREAIDAGMRSLLQHRIWIRDRGADASQGELDAAVVAMSQARERLEPQLEALGQAQHDLDTAVRERIEREAR
jgi:hypothetical protein